MIGEELILKFKNDKGYLIDDNPLSLGQMYLAESPIFFKDNAFWKIKVLNYNEDSHELFCQIIAYETNNIEFNLYQKNHIEILMKIEKVKFKSIDTIGFLRTTKRITISDNTTLQKYKERKKHIKLAENTIYQKTIFEKFFVPFDQVTFIKEGVTFEKKLKQFQEPLKFEIENQYIREEFEAIKDYFVKVLKRKRIEVSTTIEILGDTISVKEIKSPEIDQINEKIIESVRLNYIRKVYQIIKNKPKKNISTISELSNNNEDLSFNLADFYENETKFIEDLLAITKSKHYNHLKYLSQKHLANLMKIRFILNPFAFLFLIEGKSNYFFIWETLNTSEATYLWEKPKDNKNLKLYISEVEKDINEIKSIGKNNFIHQIEEKFIRIFHNYTSPEYGFNQWKNELERKLNIKQK